MAFTLGGVIHIIQTEKFASVVSQKIKKKVKKEFNAELTFKRIEVKLFPPASILRNVELKSISKNGSIEMYAGEIGLYFSVFDFFTRKFQVDTVKLNSVDLLILNQSKKRALTYSEIFNEYKTFKKNAPVVIKNLELDNLELGLNKNILSFRKLNLSFFKELILASGKLKTITSDIVPKFFLDLAIDSADFLLHFGNTSADIKKIALRSGLDTLEMSGTVKSEKSDLFVDVKSKLKAGLRSSATKIGYREVIEEYPVDGVANIDLKIKGNIKSPEYELDGEVDLIESEFGNVDKVKLSIKQKEKIVWLEKLELFKNSAIVESLNPVALYDLEKESLASNEAEFNIEKLHTNDALYALNDYLDVLKGKLNGVVKIGWNKKGIYFIPAKGFSLSELKVYTPEYDGLILKNEGFQIMKAYLFLTYDLIFKFRADLKIGKSRLIGEGSFSENKMDVSIRQSKVNLKEIGPIVGLDLYGNGKINGSIKGKYENVQFTFNPELNNLSLLDFELGQISGKVDFNLKDLSLSIKNVIGEYGGTKYVGGAEFEFDKDYFTLGIDVLNATYSDAEKMVPSLISLVSEKPLDIDFNFKGKIKYRSDFDINNLSIQASASGENVNLYGERLDSFFSEIDLRKNKLKINNLVLNKNQGNIQASGDLDLRKNKFNYKGNLAGIALKDFDAYNSMNLGLNGKLRGEFYGNGIYSNFTSRAQFRLENSGIGNRPIADSIFTIYNKGTDIFLSSNLFEGVSISEGYISLDKKNRKKSYLNSRLYTNTPSLLAGIISEHNFLNESLKGIVDLRAELSFYTDDLEKFDFDFKAKELDLDYLDDNILVDQEKNSLFVKNGRMDNWNLLIKTNNGGYFESNGKGDVSKSFQINSKFKFNPVYLRMVSPKLLSAVGSIEGSSILLREKDSYSFHSESDGKGIDLKIDKIPGALRDINFKLISEGKEVLLQKFEGQYGKGTIEGDGNIQLKLPFPIINLNGTVNSAQVAITDKTYVVISGNATLQGKTLPYLLKGGVSVLHGEVLNEFEDFSKMMGLSEGYLRYIPNSGKLSRKNILNYDMDFDIFNPVQVKNSISDLKVDGSLKIRGSLLKPLMSGDVNILPNVSRVFFKGNEFILTEGKLAFLDVNKKEVPEIKLAGVASVDRYEVGLTVDGKVDKFGIKLTSAPSLDQNQILSLLVLGVPDDINQELDDSEREQIAVQGGVGLIVERFKLVKPIDSMLGLKFSVSPEFQEDDSSLLEGRLSSGEAGASRYKSGTKIKVQKKILKKVDVSFSSTVGGTVEETKEMNVNYNINKNLSLEGVYELRSVEEETEENPESVGADIKWKFSF